MQHIAISADAKKKINDDIQGRKRSVLPCHENAMVYFVRSPGHSMVARHTLHMYNCAVACTALAPLHVWNKLSLASLMQHRP